MSETFPASIPREELVNAVLGPIREFRARMEEQERARREAEDRALAEVVTAVAE